MNLYRDRPAAWTDRAGAGQQAMIFVGIVLVLCLGLSLALPHRELTPLIAALLPTAAVALTILVTRRKGERRGEWAAVSFRPPGIAALLTAVALPVGIATASFGIAAAIGVVRLTTPSLGNTGSLLANLVLTAVAFTLLFLGEEIGWRGYLLPRLANLMSGRRAAIATGAIHAVFHLPLLLLTTTYQSAGNRWIVVPAVLVTITLAGIPYAWLRWSSGSIWPVAVMHAVFNDAMGRWTTVAVATSPASLAYTTTETGLVTVALMIVLGAVVLTVGHRTFEAGARTARSRFGRGEVLPSLEHGVLKP
jgi:membrane protease YdiL (CAAX protease family)